MTERCGNPDCFNCIWLEEAVIRFNEGMKAAIIAAAADLPPITYKLWLPGDPRGGSS